MSPPIESLMLTVEEFDARFQPEMAEDDSTYRRYQPRDPADFAYLQNLDPARVWTVVYVDDACTQPCEKCDWEEAYNDDLTDVADPRSMEPHTEPKIWLLDGFHYVNRDYCIVTSVPCPAGTTIEVPLDD